ncbi:response regulator transcription factor [Conexibacter sp. DBS9H8]|uniref:response regulator transcription factor n=1 Tax=Conexibacter sp. DBS9H8 TaxID=2937801 RepID=UPI00200E673F|nr:response regulator transcription factor [Conexibacter sp. DBS9H8]
MIEAAHPAGGTAPGARGAVLVVDDEPTITEVVARYLLRGGYSAHTAADGHEALSPAAELKPDAIVLDLMLPHLGGLEVMRRLREQAKLAGTEPPPVILLTARGEESDRITGLRLGADDYVVKPFFPAELIARIDTVLRRVHRVLEREPAIEVANVWVDPSSRRVLVDGVEVALTVREFDLLLFFVRHPGQVFSREQLMEAVWQYSFYTDTSTVTVHVRRLRAKLEENPTEPRYLQTVWGVGYRFRP